MSRPPFAPIPRELLRTSPIWNQRRRERSEPEALIDLYGMATHTRYSWSSPHGVDELNPCEFVASLRFLAERWKWSKDRCARFLARAEKARHITRQRQGHNGTIYRVEGIDSYAPGAPDDATETATAASPPIRTDVRQIKEGEKVKGTSLRAPKGATGGDDAGSGEKPKRHHHEYPPAFESTWTVYPAREGSNDKRGAFRAWSARQREGVSAEEMHAGTERYRAYCEAKGAIGGPYVMQAARFYGPSEPFRESWTVAPSSSGGNRWESYARALYQLAHDAQLLTFTGNQDSYMTRLKEAARTGQAGDASTVERDLIDLEAWTWGGKPEAWVVRDLGTRLADRDNREAA